MSDSSELPIERGQDQVALKHACEQLATAIDGDTSNPEAWVRNIQATCHSLFAVVTAQQETAEGEDGVMAELVAEKPGLLPRTNRLVHEHVDMLHRAMEIDDQVERQLAFQQIDVEPIRLKPASFVTSPKSTSCARVTPSTTHTSRKKAANPDKPGRRGWNRGKTITSTVELCSGRAARSVWGSKD